MIRVGVVWTSCTQTPSLTGPATAVAPCVDADRSSFLLRLVRQSIASHEISADASLARRMRRVHTSSARSQRAFDKADVLAAALHLRRARDLRTLPP